MTGRPQKNKGIFQNKCFLAICFLWWFLLVHLTWATMRFKITMKSPCVLGICLNHHLFLIEEFQNRSEVVLLGMEGTVRLVLLGILWLEFLESHRFSANKVVSAKGRLFYQKNVILQSHLWLKVCFWPGEFACKKHPKMTCRWKFPTPTQWRGVVTVFLSGSFGVQPRGHWLRWWYSNLRTCAPWYVVAGFSPLDVVFLGATVPFFS